MGEVSTDRFYVIWQRDDETDSEGASTAATSAVTALNQIIKDWEIEPAWIQSVRRVGPTGRAKIKHRSRDVREKLP